eukprot:Unigene6496_Nuclearia_a/m.19988 Unigene6496_Nuclearia_a/g.19988  ORF Unigene6496_Nuclearia_a/g.19988 Unigene6496_Nuclearia_a/m.19988 type:complete len:330 (-) Unigene6496_Nuclearia_a:11-1000(-)
MGRGAPGLSATVGRQAARLHVCAQGGRVLRPRRHRLQGGPAVLRRRAVLRRPPDQDDARHDPGLLPARPGPRRRWPLRGRDQGVRRRPELAHAVRVDGVVQGPHRRQRQVRGDRDAPHGQDRQGLADGARHQRQVPGPRRGVQDGALHARDAGAAEAGRGDDGQGAQGLEAWPGHLLQAGADGARHLPRAAAGGRVLHVRRARQPHAAAARRGVRGHGHRPRADVRRGLRRARAQPRVPGPLRRGAARGRHAAAVPLRADVGRPDRRRPALRAPGAPAPQPRRGRDAARRRALQAAVPGAGAAAGAGAARAGLLHTVVLPVASACPVPI